MLQVKQTVHFTDPPHSIIVDSVKLLSGNGPSGAKDIEDGEVVVGSSGDSSEESGSKSDTSDMVTEEGTDCRGEEDDDSSSDGNSTERESLVSEWDDLSDAVNDADDEASD